MKKALYILFLLSILPITASDILEKQLEYANQLFANEKYYEAITEYKRLAFFDEEKIYEYETKYKIGLAYKKGGFYQNAIEYLSKAKLSTKDFDEKAEIEFQIIRTNILRKTPQRALQLLEQIESDSSYMNNTEKIEYWRGWAFMVFDQWNSAATSFSRISDDNELKLLCEQVDNDKYSVTFARVISYILPGAGQFYTGNYFSGLMSLAWNSLWGYLTVNAFVKERAFDGVAIGSLLWLRFYRGNVQNAGKLAEIKNIEIANKALSFIMENYRGEKP